MGVLDAVLSEINKRYGKGTILSASEAKTLSVNRLPSGIFDFDMKLGGGFPRGRITTVKGEFSTGKSAVCMKTAAQAQRHCRYCGKAFQYVDLLGEVHEFECKCGKKDPMRVVWLDAEHSFDTGWAARWGVNIDDIYVIQSEYAEQAIDVADACIRSKECDLLIVDSVAALTPSIEIRESAENQQMGVMARLLNKAMRKWTSATNSYGMLGETACTILLINQMRVNLGGYRPGVTSPGGKGIDFFQSVEVRFKKTGDILDAGTDRPVGIQIEYVIKKNKTAPLMPGGQFNLYFVGDKNGYQVGDTDNDAQVLRLAGYWHLIEKTGAWYTFPDGTRAQGDAKAALAIKQNPELLRNLEDRIRERELSWATEVQDLGGGREG